jgi:hypothetical protein
VKDLIPSSIGAILVARFAFVTPVIPTHCEGVKPTPILATTMETILKEILLPTIDCICARVLWSVTPVIARVYKGDL